MGFFMMLSAMLDAIVHGPQVIADAAKWIGRKFRDRRANQ